jgi:ferredoxin--NADP+ reductase
MSEIEKIEILYPDLEINIVRAKEPIEVPIVESRIATAVASPNFVRHITFDISGTPLEGKFHAGQSIGVLADGVDENGKPHKVRLYSVCSPSFGEDGHGKLVATTVKRVIDENWETQELYTGVCSNYLSNQKVGSVVKVTGPSGKRFILPENPQDYNYLFFGTGTGVAPFRGMIMDLMKLNSKNEIVLIFGSPYRTDILYGDYFKSLDEKIDNFHFLTSISRENLRPDGTKYYVQYQLLDNKALLEPILQKPNTLIYVCGLKGMETGIYQILAQQGLWDYITVKDDLIQKNPLSWTYDELKTGVKSSDRMHIEVY